MTDVPPQAAVRTTTSNLDGDVEIVVAGHICLDIIPTLTSSQTRAEDIFVPGRLLNIGPATIALGGAVSNAGTALHRLGFNTRLAGKVGDDLLGHTILASLRRIAPHLANSMVVAAGEASSYSIVLNPPGVDRCFLHCTGTNDTFVASDLPLDLATSGKVLHFGYPPLMRGTYLDGGRGLRDKLSDVRKIGVLTSLDMAMPDPDAESGQVDWRSWLQRVLPQVDIFLPSLDEILLMLNPDYDSQLTARVVNPSAAADTNLLHEITTQLLDWGARIVGLKLGDQGLYLRTASDLSALENSRLKSLSWPAWRAHEMLAPCFSVDVVGTTGSGDCTVAGFLGGLLRGLSAQETLRHAVAVGAFNVESADATSGIPHWSDVAARLHRGWSHKELAIPMKPWREDGGLWYPPRN